MRWILAWISIGRGRISKRRACVTAMQVPGSAIYRCSFIGSSASHPPVRKGHPDPRLDLVMALAVSMGRPMRTSTGVSGRLPSLSTLGQSLPASNMPLKPPRHGRRT